MINHMQYTFIDLLQKLALDDGDMWLKPLLVPLPSEQQENRLNFNQTRWEIKCQRTVTSFTYYQTS